MRRKKTFEVEFNWFQPGTAITPIDPGYFETGKTYFVKKCVEPVNPGDDCVVFIEGLDLGYDAGRFKEVE